MQPMHACSRHKSVRCNVYTHAAGGRVGGQAGIAWQAAPWQAVCSSSWLLPRAWKEPSPLLLRNGCSCAGGGGV